jgi:threonine aldolase
MPLDNGLIDLRSDTVTQPTAEMRRAMAAAEVGDDVFDDDPTVHALQERAAVLTGHEAGLLVPSGTMGNLVALLTHVTGRGSEVIVGDKSHIYLNEGGGMAALAGAQAAVVRNQPDGTLDLEDLRAIVRNEDVHHPRTRLVCLENTHNVCGGVALSADYTRRVAGIAREQGLKFHLDGARLFNAAVAQAVPASDLAGPADSVTFCLSKGLSAPIGSVLCGPADFIREARRFRKMAGGGMRQVGVIAAAGLVALERMIERLEDDHVNAQRLADGLTGLPGLVVENPNPATNMVYLRLTERARADVPAVAERLAQRGIVLYPGAYGFRLVTHAGVTREDVERVLIAFRETLTKN